MINLSFEKFGLIEMKLNKFKSKDLTKILEILIGLLFSYMTEEHEETSYTLRIGSLVLHNVGQLLPHQLQSAVFHNRNFIYPVCDKIIIFCCKSID
jgi:hypothetical protein